MTPHVKVQRPAVQIGLILDAGRNDGLEAGRASLAGTLTCPHAPGVVALDIARPEHSSNAFADLSFGHARLRRIWRSRETTSHDTALESTDQELLSRV